MSTIQQRTIEQAIALRNGYADVTCEHCGYPGLDDTDTHVYTLDDGDAVYCSRTCAARAHVASVAAERDIDFGRPSFQREAVLDGPMADLTRPVPGRETRRSDDCGNDYFKDRSMLRRTGMRS